MKAETGINAFFTSGVPSPLHIERLSIEVTSFTQDIAKLDWTMDWTWKKQILETKQVMTLTMFLRKNKKNVPSMLAVLLLMKRAKIMFVFPNYNAGTIYKGLAQALIALNKFLPLSDCFQINALLISVI